MKEWEGCGRDRRLSDCCCRQWRLSSVVHSGSVQNASRQMDPTEAWPASACFQWLRVGPGGGSSLNFWCPLCTGWAGCSWSRMKMWASSSLEWKGQSEVSPHSYGTVQVSCSQVTCSGLHNILLKFPFSYPWMPFLSFLWKLHSSLKSLTRYHVLCEASLALPPPPLTSYHHSVIRPSDILLMSWKYLLTGLSPSLNLISLSAGLPLFISITLAQSQDMLTYSTHFY